MSQTQNGVTIMWNNDRQKHEVVMAITTREELRERLLKLDRDDLPGLLNIAGEVDPDSEISQYQIVIHGNNYHGSIDAAYAHVLLSFQKQIDSLCGTVRKRGGTFVKFEVRDNCTTLLSESLRKAFEKALGGMVNKMTPKTIAVLAVLGIIAYGGYCTVDLFLNHQIELEKIATSNALNKELATATKEMSACQNEVAKYLAKTAAAGMEIRNETLRRSPLGEVEDVSINGRIYDHEEIAEFQAPASPRVTTMMVSEEFVIQELRIPDRGQVKIIVKMARNPQYGEFSLTASSGGRQGTMTPDELRDLSCDAIKNKGRKLKLQAEITFRNCHEIN